MSSREYTKHSDLPSVTQVLAPYSGYDKIPPWHLEKASERGTVVHEHLAAYALGQWTPAPILEYSGYVQSGTMWLDAFMDEAIMVEEELEDKELGYCGHPDLMIKSKKLGGVIHIDYKTPVAVHRKVWGCQLSAYGRLAMANSYPAADRFGSLRLSASGRMAKFDEFSDNRIAYWGAFFAALAAHRFFTEVPKNH